MTTLVQYAASLGDLADSPPPPVDRWDPPDRGPIDITILADGTWVHEGEPIRRARLVRLFASILRREGADYYLVTPAEKRRITVVDAPFTAIALECEGAGRDQALIFKTNLGARVTAGPDHPLQFRVPPPIDRSVGGPVGGPLLAAPIPTPHIPTPHIPVPYIHVRSGLDAKVARPVYYELVDHIEVDETDATTGLWSGGVFFPVPAAG